MSKYTNSIVLLLFLISPISNAKLSKNCEGLLPITEKSVVGSWTESIGDLDSYITYKSDNTFMGRIEKNRKTIWEFKGNWHMQGHLKYSTYTYSSVDQIPLTTDTDEILEVTCDKFKFKNKNGRTGIVKRINP